MKIITLHGRIDSQTAGDTERIIFQELGQCENEGAAIDFSDVAYISSSGLRVLLKAKKAHDDLMIINVNPDAYEVFDMTGFNKIMTVKKVMREVSVEGCEILGQGGHGTVYRIDEDTIIKVYGKQDPLEEIEREITYARTAFLYGIPTAIAFDVVKCGELYGAVFELIKADTLANAICKNPDKFEEYKEKYLELIDTLHTTEVDTSKFSSIKDLYNKWIDDAAIIYTAEEIDLLHRIVNSVPDRKTLVHGDIHPKNIMIQDGELVLIDMADITYGHPIFDFGGMGLTHWIMASRTPEYAPSIVGVEADKVKALWAALLEHSFAGLSEEEREREKHLVETFTLLKLTLAPVVNKNSTPERTQGLVKTARETFFPMAEKWKNLDAEADKGI